MLKVPFPAKCGLILEKGCINKTVCKIDFEQVKIIKLLHRWFIPFIQYNVIIAKVYDAVNRNER